MTKLRKRTEEIRQFIVENVGQYPKDIANLTARQFDITRQAVNKHIQSLVEQSRKFFEVNAKSKILKSSSGALLTTGKLSRFKILFFKN